MLRSPVPEMAKIKKPKANVVYSSSSKSGHRESVEKTQVAGDDCLSGASLKIQNATTKLQKKNATQVFDERAKLELDSDASKSYTLCTESEQVS